MCGIIGIYSPGSRDIARSVYFGLHSLQHRGQESAGIAVSKNGEIKYHKEMGLVQEVFNDEIIDSLKGDISIGHVRYSTTGESYVVNAMPLVVSYKGGTLALAHNGNLVNAKEIRSTLQEEGIIFQTSIDSEVIATLIAKFSKESKVEEAIEKSLKIVRGSYALVIMFEEKLIGIRDPLGIRPLCIGKTADGFVLASESCVFPLIGAKLIRDVEPGEMIVIENGELISIKMKRIDQKKASCAFEYVYLARPDSDLDNKSIYNSRRAAGKILAYEHPVSADLVIAVPESGTVAAMGYAEASGIKFGEGLIKNRYVGRTFIQPNQELRELSVHMKLNVLKQNVEGKRIIMIDDSIVRGTTCGQIVKMLKEAGAKEVHVRVCSPPVTDPCFFGIDTPSKKNLIAANFSIEEIKDKIGADSLAYISIEGLWESIGLGGENICAACFNGAYPIELKEEPKKNIFECIAV